MLSLALARGTQTEPPRHRRRSPRLVHAGGCLCRRARSMSAGLRRIAVGLMRRLAALATPSIGHALVFQWVCPPHSGWAPAETLGACFGGQKTQKGEAGSPHPLHAAGDQSYADRTADRQVSHPGAGARRTAKVCCDATVALGQGLVGASAALATWGGRIAAAAIPSRRLQSPRMAEIISPNPSKRLRITANPSTSN